MQRVAHAWRRLRSGGGRPSLGGVRESRQVVVREGPGAGLVLDLVGASADYGAGANELPVQQAVVDTLAAGDVFVDVGANVGYFSLLAARAVGPTGRVVAIEAVSEIAEAARANADRNGFGHIEVIEAAASDAAGEVELMLAEHPGGATISADDVPPDLTGRRTVRTVTLDGLVEAGDVPAPSMVKIDVEGAEFAVLDGMVDVMATHRPVVLCEFDSAEPAALDQKVARFRELMVDRGYEVRDLSPSYEGADWNVYHGLALPSGDGAGQRSGL
jgi:FkbM family methyltransferase